STATRNARNPCTPCNSSTSSSSMGPDQVAGGREVVEVLAILLGFAGWAYTTGDLPRVRYALVRASEHRLVDALLDDLVADVVGPVDVEALLVGTKADRQGCVVGQD